MELIIADTGALISLEIAGQIQLLDKIFGRFYIAKAVWEELQDYYDSDAPILDFMRERVSKLDAKSHLNLIMDYGEAESVILYEELEADYLLVDDNQARMIAEMLGVNCIGSLGVLIRAKEQNLIGNLRPIFEKWLQHKRHFSLKLLNSILQQLGEESIPKKRADKE